MARILSCGTRSLIDVSGKWRRRSRRTAYRHRRAQRSHSTDGGGSASPARARKRLRAKERTGRPHSSRSRRNCHAAMRDRRKDRAHRRAGARSSCQRLRIRAWFATPAPSSSNPISHSAQRASLGTGRGGFDPPTTTAVSVVLLLLAPFGSDVSLLATAVFTIVVGADESTEYCALTVTLAPAASVPSAHGKPPAHGALAPMNESPAGVASDSIAATASSGPLLLTTIV